MQLEKRARHPTPMSRVVLHPKREQRSLNRSIDSKAANATRMRQQRALSGTPEAKTADATRKRQKRALNDTPESKAADATRKRQKRALNDTLVLVHPTFNIRVLNLLDRR